MSLDVYLKHPDTRPKESAGKIFVRENGTVTELTREEWDRRNPGREPCVATVTSDEAYSANITHNLNRMADAAGIYGVLWRPDENGITKAKQLIAPLETGLAKLRADPERFKEFNPSNGWGNYETLVRFVENYLQACMEQPEAEVSVWR